MSVPDLVDTCTAISPEAIALSSDGVDVTYRQLNESANQLAHYLVSLGVRDESLVGICLNRSLAGVVSALGVLKSGGAYLPIDPAYPTERIAFMLDDAQPRVLITTSAVAKQLPSGNCHVITIDDGKLLSDIEGIAKQPTTAPVCEINSEQLAYVIYTSGSPANPKASALYTPT